MGPNRASSNKPSLVIVTESPTSDKIDKINFFYFIDKLLNETGKIGEYGLKDLIRYLNIYKQI